MVLLLPATLLAIPSAPFFFAANIYDILFLPHYLATASVAIQTICILTLAPFVSLGLASTWITVFRGATGIRQPEHVFLRTCLFLGIIGESATLVWLLVVYASLERWSGTAAIFGVIGAWSLILVPPIIIAGNCLRVGSIPRD